MKKNRFTIISKREHITAQALVKENAVTFSYEVTNGQVSGVSFSLRRGVSTPEQPYAPEAFRGAMYGEVFNVENNAYQIGDALLYEEIFALCKEIIRFPNASPSSSEEGELQQGEITQNTK